MDFTKLAYLLTKDVNTLIFTLIVIALVLSYFKYIKHPHDTLVEDIKEVNSEIDKLKKELTSLESSLDTVQQARISEATRNEQTLEKVDELKIKVSKLEERLSDLRVEIATLSSRK